MALQGIALYLRDGIIGIQGKHQIVWDARGVGTDDEQHIRSIGKRRDCHLKVLWFDSIGERESLVFHILELKTIQYFLWGQWYFGQKQILLRTGIDEFQ